MEAYRVKPKRGKGELNLAENRGEIEGWIGENEVGAVGKQNHGFIDVVNGETEVQRPGEKAIEERSEELVQRLLGFVRIQKRLKIRKNNTTKEIITSNKASNTSKSSLCITKIDSLFSLSARSELNSSNFPRTPSAFIFRYLHGVRSGNTISNPLFDSTLTFEHVLVSDWSLRIQRDFV